MLWKRRDMGSDPMDPIFVTKDIPTTGNDKFVQVEIPILAYNRLVDWCSMGRTLDNVLKCLCLESEDDRAILDVAYEEMEALHIALELIHDSIRNHYGNLPVVRIDKRK